MFFKLFVNSEVLKTRWSVFLLNQRGDSRPVSELQKIQLQEKSALSRPAYMQQGLQQRWPE